MSFWVLEHNGRYFRDITGIGPRYTINQHEAATFASKEEAMRSPAYSHPFAMCEPKQIGRAKK